MTTNKRLPDWGIAAIALLVSVAVVALVWMVVT